jgi:hypothetical protein
VQTNQDDWEAQLLELAQTTERVADAVGIRMIADRLRAIADEVRSMAQQSQDLSETCCMLA